MSRSEPMDALENLLFLQHLACDRHAHSHRVPTTVSQRRSRVFAMQRATIAVLGLSLSVHERSGPGFWLESLGLVQAPLGPRVFSHSVTLDDVPRCLSDRRRPSQRTRSSATLGTTASASSTERRQSSWRQPSLQTPSSQWQSSSQPASQMRL